MSYGKTLIDKALVALGTKYRVSKETGISQTSLSLIAAGKQRMGPVMAAKLANAAGVDPREATAHAIIENTTDPQEKQVLTNLFFQARRQVMGGLRRRLLRKTMTPK